MEGSDSYFRQEHQKKILEQASTLTPCRPFNLTPDNGTTAVNFSAPSTKLGRKAAGFKGNPSIWIGEIGDTEVESPSLSENLIRIALLNIESDDYSDL